MSEILSTITTFTSTVFGDWLPLTINAITGHSILLLFVCGVPLVGISVGIFNRLIRSN